MPGIFTISLDFELHWGSFDKRDRIARKKCYENTIQLIPELLELFTANNVHVTWAAVGSLFAKDDREWESLKPVVEPEYANPSYSSYEWVRKNGIGKAYWYAHFASEVVQQITQYSGQELGTHTFGHYYCLESPLNAAAFAADLDAAKKAAKKFNSKPVSLVFPRNQFNQQFLKICYEKGIRTVRSNPDKWFWTPVTDGDAGFTRKIFRTGEGYISIGKRTSYPLHSIKRLTGEPIQIPASRLLRAWQPGYRFANKLHLKRIMSELRRAAIKNECYHLWWHPKNFGDYPTENMDNLKIILAQFRQLRKVYGMKSWNMKEYADYFYMQ